MLTSAASALAVGGWIELWCVSMCTTAIPLCLLAAAGQHLLCISIRLQTNLPSCHTLSCWVQKEGYQCIIPGCAGILTYAEGPNK